MTDPVIDYSYIFDSNTTAPDRRKRKGGYKKQQTIQEQFLAFHSANPFVYGLLVKFARMVKAKGIHNYSVQALMEQVRWHVIFEEEYTYTPGAFKLNNNYCAHYARMIMRNEPDLHGMFSVRVLKAA